MRKTRSVVIGGRKHLPVPGGVLEFEPVVNQGTAEEADVYLDRFLDGQVEAYGAALGLTVEWRYQEYLDEIKQEVLKTSRALTYRPSVRRFHPWSEIIHRQQPWWRRLLAKVRRW